MNINFNSLSIFFSWSHISTYRYTSIPHQKALMKIYGSTWLSREKSISCICHYGKMYRWHLLWTERQNPWISHCPNRWKKVLTRALMIWSMTTSVSKLGVLAFHCKFICFIEITWRILNLNIYTLYTAECLKQEFKNYSTVGTTHLLDGSNYTFPNCTMPWHQSMLGITSYNGTENICSADDSYTLYYLDYTFLSNALKGDSCKPPECFPPKCQGNRK